MKPINFPESNCVLSKPKDMTDEECGHLFIHRTGQQCISCWKLTLLERINILLFGRIWLWVWSGDTQPPVALDARKTIFVKPSN